MPDVTKILYWYGWKLPEAELIRTENGWNADNASPYYMTIYNGAQWQTNRVWWSHPAKGSGGFISGVKLTGTLNNGTTIKWIGYSNSDMQFAQPSAHNSRYFSISAGVTIRQLGAFNESSVRTGTLTATAKDFCMIFATGSAATGYLYAVWIP